jgi:hypothetical protein
LCEVTETVLEEADCFGSLAAIGRPTGCTAIIAIEHPDETERGKGTAAHG